MHAAHAKTLAARCIHVSCTSSISADDRCLLFFNAESGCQLSLLASLKCSVLLVRRGIERSSWVCLSVLSWTDKTRGVSHALR